MIAVPAWRDIVAKRDGRLLAASLAGVVVFLLLVLIVLRGWSDSFDMTIVLALRDGADPSLPMGRPWIRDVGRDVSAIGGSVLFLVVVVATVAFRRQKAACGTLLVVVLGARLAAALLKSTIGRPRPGAVLHSTFVHTSSFPSTHVTVTTATCVVLAFLVSRKVPDRADHTMIYWLAAILAGGVGASRVYLGVHWPTDALAGWLVGGCWAFLVLYIDPFGASRRRVETRRHLQRSD